MALTHDMVRRRARRQLLVRLDNRRMLWVAGLTGLAAGIVATLFHVLVDFIAAKGPTWALVFWRSAWFAPPLLIGAGILLGAGASLLTLKTVPEAAGSGIPRVKMVLSGLRVLRPGKVIMVKLGAGLMALATGMSLGREGPTIHMGAAAAALIHRWARLPARALSPLIAAGGGAGLAAAFNAPLAGFLFVMEELRREFSPSTYGTALIAAIGAVAVTRFATGEALSIDLPSMTTYELALTPLAILIGLGGLVVGWLFNTLLMQSLHWRDRLRISPALIGALAGGLGTAALIFWPDVAFGGHDLSERALNGAFQGGLGLLAVTLAAKLLFTVLCYASAVPGGIFLPLLTLGSLYGVGAALIGQMIIPGFSASPTLLGTIGMAAVLTGSVRAPLTSVVLIVEMTGEYHLLYVLLVAAFATHALGEWLGLHGIYDRLVDRDLGRVTKALDSEGAVVEAMIEEGADLDGRRLASLAWPEGLFIASVDRDGTVLPPFGRTRLQAGDVLTIVVAPGADRRALAGILAGRPDPFPSG